MWEPLIHVLGTLLDASSKDLSASTAFRLFLRAAGLDINTLDQSRVSGKWSEPDAPGVGGRLQGQGLSESTALPQSKD